MTTTSGAKLREQMAKVGRAKAESRRAEIEAHLRLSPGERIAATLVSPRQRCSCSRRATASARLSTVKGLALPVELLGG